MTRVLVEGVPAWKNAAGDLFYYDQDSSQTPLQIGTAGAFADDWAEIVEERLTAYRTSTAAPRQRRVAAPAKKN